MHDKDLSESARVKQFEGYKLAAVVLLSQTPRDCDDYWSEFRHCKSLWNRFHHYYAYGTLPSCHRWKEDYNNCRDWEKHRTPTAKHALQTSERNRVEEQRNFTPVWTMRKDPPSDWHMPLTQENPQDP